MALTVVLFAVSGAVTAASASGTCRADAVFLRGDWGTVRFTVEIADDPAEQAQGLMHRAQMASSAGMLFIYPRPCLSI